MYYLLSNHLNIAHVGVLFPVSHSLKNFLLLFSPLTLTFCIVMLASIANLLVGAEMVISHHFRRWSITCKGRLSYQAFGVLLISNLGVFSGKKKKNLNLRVKVLQVNRQKFKYSFACLILWIPQLNLTMWLCWLITKQPLLFPLIKTRFSHMGISHKVGFNWRI